MLLLQPISLLVGSADDCTSPYSLHMLKGHRSFRASTFNWVRGNHHRQNNRTGAEQQRIFFFLFFLGNFSLFFFFDFYFVLFFGALLVIRTYLSEDGAALVSSMLTIVSTWAIGRRKKERASRTADSGTNTSGVWCSTAGG